MSAEPIAQIIGFIAFALGVTAFLQKDDKKLRLIMMAQALTLCVHFILLGRHTGAASVFVTGVRNGVSVFGWAQKIAPVFFVAVLFFGWLTYDSPVDIFPILAGVIGTTAFFYLSGIRMRLTLVLSSSMWLIHNIIVGSIGPAFMEAFMMGAGIYRAYMLCVEHKTTKGNDEALTL